MKVNGSLVFDASSASEIQNLRIQKYAGASVPAWTSNDMGRAIYTTSAGGAYAANTLYIGGATDWVAIATGGNAAALQTEVDAIETTLGAAITASGAFNVAGFVGDAFAVAPTSFTDAINKIAAFASGKDQLSELLDVQMIVPQTGDVLRFNGTKWADASLTEAGIQSQDAGLDALAAKSSTGILVQTGAETYSSVSLQAPAAGFTISNNDGVAGNPTFTLANDLAALEGLSTVGYIVRTGDGTATTRSLAVNAGELVITGAANGVGTDTTFGLATVTDSGSGSFVKIARDSFGRVSGTTPVTTADVTALVDATYVNVAGDSMNSGASLVFSGSGTVTGLPAPTIDTDAANKAYVDAVAAGLSWKQAVRVATTGNVTLASTSVVDGVTLANGERVLVKNQTAAAENGIYVFNGTGLVRASDMDSAAEFSGATVFVTEGTVNADSGWTQTAEVVTLGTTAVSWAQFSGSATYTWGVGLSSSGNTINVNLGAGIAQLPSDEVGIDLFDSLTGAIILTDDGTTRAAAPATNSKLQLLLDPGATGGLGQGSAGLYVLPNGITNAMILNDTMVVNGDTGTGSLALGGTLEVKGSSVQGIITSVNGTGTFTVTAADASTTQKGVSSFDTNHFSVTGGAVSLAATLDDLTNVSTADAAATNSLLQKSAGDWVAVSTATVLGTGLLGDLSDVGTATPTDGEVLVGNGTTWNNQKVYHLHDQASASTTWTVTHNIGQKYCNVTVVDSTDEVVIPMSITFDSTTSLTVVFNTAIAGKVVVMGVA